MIRRLESKMLGWLTRRKEERLLLRHGGIQTCPWCRQCAQFSPDWSLVPSEEHPTLDVLTCGVCGGTSLWLFAIGMVPMAPLAPPLPDPEFPNRLGQHT
ncbi:hypothetical protein [Rhodovarius crocodyli]|uniref:hypothetical protein n=1 Tax=Rhodovarius crocodyli TaxID=1979269 RepID=UPI0013E36A4D|nr:hypothetical protein [Rhodovarius crocodyli]